MSTKKQTIRITEKLMDRQGSCRDVTAQRVVKPYGTSDHYVSYKGQTVLVKQYRNMSGWFGSCVV